MDSSDVSLAGRGITSDCNYGDKRCMSNGNIQQCTGLSATHIGKLHGRYVSQRSSTRLARSQVFEGYHL